MRTTNLLLAITFFASISAQATETFDLNLPEEVTQASSTGFVSAYEKDLGPKAPVEVVTTFKEPPQSPHYIPEEPQGGYSSAFTSYKSTKSADDLQEESKDSWNNGLAKQDGLDIDNYNLSDSGPEDNRYFSASKSVNTSVPTSRQIGKKMKGTHASVAQRAPASEDIPLPTGMDIEKEIEKVDDSSSLGGAPVSAKERKAMVMSTISRNYGDLKKCYHDGQKSKSEMKGKVKMSWSMDKNGKVSGAEVVTSELNDKKVENCMVSKLSNWSFPRQAKIQGTKDSMSYTFQFAPEHD